MKTSKWLSWALAICLLLGTVPLGALAAEENSLTGTMEVTFGQTEAREMTEAINAFRTGPDAWYWNSGDQDKTQCSNLPRLVYDYALEKIAMQRAAEIALSFSHTRPDGTDCFTAVEGEVKSYGENIAAVPDSLGVDHKTGDVVFALWQESDKDYAGQGHRRNMLNSSFTAVGIGHAEVDGVHYWVQEFGNTPSEMEETKPNDEKTGVEITAQGFTVKAVTLPGDGRMTLTTGASADLPAVRVDIRYDAPKEQEESRATWPPETGSRSLLVVPQWSAPKDDRVYTLADGKLSAVKPGSVTLTATVADTELTVQVTIQDPPEAVLRKGKPATCLTSGTRDYYETEDGKFYEDEACSREITDLETWKVIAPLGHDWKVTYDFADDGSKCTATAVCTRDSSHRETAEAVITSSQNKAPTCIARGETTYIASFDEDWAKTQTKTVADVDKADHSYQWVVDKAPTKTEPGSKHQECTVCHAKKEPVEIPPETHEHKGTLVPGKKPTCTETGVKDYYTCRCGLAFEDEACTREVKDPDTWKVIPALDHKWGETEYSFVSDGSACVAKRVCLNDPSHQETAKAAVTHEQTRKPTCSEKGETTYTAVFGVDWAEQQTLTVSDIPKGEHDYRWVVDKDATDTEPGSKHQECAVCHDQKDPVQIPVAHKHHGKLVRGYAATCSGTGKRDYYTCKCGKNFKDAACTKPIDNLDVWRVIPARGHNWGIPHYTFSRDGSKCTAKRVCLNDPTHVQTAEAKVTAEVTMKPTCAKKGETTYTAKFTESWAREQTLVIPDIPKSDHDYEWVVDKEPTMTRPGSRHQQCTVCGHRLDAEEIPSLQSSGAEYPVTGGDRQEYAIGNQDGMTFTVDADAALLKSVYVNDKLVYPSNYTLESGGTVLTFTPEYLEEMGPGAYTLRLEYADGGIAGASFQLTKSAAESGGSGWLIILFACITALSAAGIVAVALVMKKRSGGRYSEDNDEEFTQE